MSEPTRLDCGCSFQTVSGAFVWTACAAGQSCRWVRYVVAESRRQGKPCRIVEAKR